MTIYVNSNKNRVIYTSITDHINKYPYKLLDIPSYSEKLSDYELDPNTAGPIRYPIPGEVSCGMYPINWMIQAYHDHIPFTFERPSDVCHATYKLDEYVEQLRNRKDPLSKDEQSYLDKALIFLSEMKKQTKIVLSRSDKLKITKEYQADALFSQFLDAAKTFKSTKSKETDKKWPFNQVQAHNLQTLPFLY